MKARRLILTAGVVVALAGPATQPAGAMIQNDGGSRSKSVALHELQLARAGQATAIKVGAYNARAYVQGGASPAVAKAITKAGKRHAKKVTPPRSTVDPPRVGKGAGSAGATSGSTGGTVGTGGIALGDPDACQQYSICTDAELCAIWGLGCLLIEQPPTEIAAPEPQLPAVDPPAGGGEMTTQALSGAEGVDPYDTAYLYQDC